MDVIRTGRKVREFLNDPDVQALFSAYKQAAYLKFLSAKTDEDRRMLQAEAKTLDTIEGVLLSAIEHGQHAEEAAESGK